MPHSAKSPINLIVLCLTFFASAATAQQSRQADILVTSDGKLSLGIKAWSADWRQEARQNKVDGSVDSSEGGGSALTLTPTLQYRYKDVAVSLSTFLKQNFDFKTTPIISGNESVETAYSSYRKEYDFNLIYFIKPNISASIGYKKLSLNNSNYTVRGPIVGFSASAPLMEGLNLYATLGLGALKLKEGSEFDVRYTLTEVGLAYSLHEWISNSSTTISYREQKVKATNHFPRMLFRSERYSDTTGGIALGFSKSF